MKAYVILKNRKILHKIVDLNKDYLMEPTACGLSIFGNAKIYKSILKKTVKCKKCFSNKELK